MQPVDLECLSATATTQSKRKERLLTLYIFSVKTPWRMTAPLRSSPNMDEFSQYFDIMQRVCIRACLDSRWGANVPTPSMFLSIFLSRSELCRRDVWDVIFSILSLITDMLAFTLLPGWKIFVTSTRRPRRTRRFGKSWSGSFCCFRTSPSRMSRMVPAIGQSCVTRFSTSSLNLATRSKSSSMVTPHRPHSDLSWPSPIPLPTRPGFLYVKSQPRNQGCYCVCSLGRPYLEPL